MYFALSSKMSHQKLREAKDCLNCGHHVEDRYCTHCGQENVEVRESAIHLVIHYIQDLFHYEGRFWHTLKNLLIRPGFVPSEYLAGRRKQHLDPVRFYVFTSTIFFIGLFYVFNFEQILATVEPKYNFSKRIYNLEEEKKFIGSSPDTTIIDSLISNIRWTIDSLDALENDTVTPQFELNVFPESSGDSIRADASWLDKLVQKRSEKRQKEMEKRYGGDEIRAGSALLDEILHKAPMILFLSMPFFAFFLRLLYFRSSRRLYVDHIIFSVYHYSFSYVLLSAGILSYIIKSKIDTPVLDSIYNWSLVVFILYLFWYLLISMKRFYKDRWVFLMLRYGLMMLLMLVTILFIFILLVFITYLWG